MEMNFDANNLIPAVCQDVNTREVLMVAWMNPQALQRTRESGQAHFWSRSRQELWHKGATSGNVLTVREIRVDCDADTLLLLVEPAGPACHSGARSCMYRSVQADGQIVPLEPAAARPFNLQELYRVIAGRKTADPAGSYTARLLASGSDKILQKVGEEAIETILAASGQGRRRLIEESADLLYHLLVLLVSQDLGLQDIEAELAARHKEK